MNLLAAYKGQLEKAKQTVAQAKDLIMIIEKLEVTLCMIPSRGDQDAIDEMKSSTVQKPRKNNKDEGEKKKRETNSGTVIFFEKLINIKIYIKSKI